MIEQGNLCKYSALRRPVSHFSKCSPQKRDSCFVFRRKRLSIIIQIELVSWSVHEARACTSRFSQFFRLCYCAWQVVSLRLQNKVGEGGGGCGGCFSGCRFEKIQVWPKGGIIQTAAVWSFLSRVQPAGRGRMKLTGYTQDQTFTHIHRRLITWLAQMATNRRQSGMSIRWSRLPWATSLGTQNVHGVSIELTSTFPCHFFFLAHKLK